MDWMPGERATLDVDGTRLEAACHGPAPGDAPTLVLLHEGLGCTALWRDFPARLAEATGWGVFAWSRAGYGHSDPAALPRPLDYMEREAHGMLGRVLDGFGFERGVLVGHSDGASIAALYAGGISDHRVRGTVLIAPHFFTEPTGLAAIGEARRAYDDGDLRSRLARYHADVDGAFRGWNDAWLDPRFEAWDVTDAIDHLRVPTLAIQGEADPYGTRAQVDALVERSYAPVELLMLPGCAHAPHVERPDETVAAIDAFVRRLEALEATGSAIVS